MQADNLAFMDELEREWDAWNEHVEHREFASPRSPKRKFDESMGRSDNVPPPPAGPPPAYSPPANGPFGGGDEKSAFAGFPSLPTYNEIDEKGEKGGEGAGNKEESREVEMQTKENVPRLISTMSMDVREKGDDAMDVDDLKSTDR